MFNHNTLEQDIERLSREISEKKLQPEHKDYSERDIIKQAIQPLIKKQDESSGGQVPPSSSGDGSVLPNYLQKSPTEVKLKVEQLIDSVFHEGLEKAIKEAKLAGPFVLDAFHDALTDKLHEELKKRKLI